MVSRAIWVLILTAAADGRYPDVNISGLVEFDSFKIEWETSDIPSYTEFLTHERTYCWLTGFFGACKPYNYTVSTRKIMITARGLPGEYVYGCEMIFTVEDNTYLVYSSGIFDQRVFKPKRVNRTPIGIKGTDDDIDKEREEKQNDQGMLMYVMIFASVVYAMCIILLVFFKKHIQRRRQQQTSYVQATQSPSNVPATQSPSGVKATQSPSSVQATKSPLDTETMQPPLNDEEMQLSSGVENTKRNTNVTSC